MTRILSTAVLAACVAAAVGCSNTSNTNVIVKNVNEANTAAANSSASNSVASNSTAANTADTAPGVTGSPSEIYKAAHIARQKKDVATLKKLFSKEILEFFTEIGKADKKTVDDMILEMCEKAPAGDAEVRNEKINGNRATVEYKEDGKWKTGDFVMEEGGWKMSLPEMDSKDLEIETKPKKGN